MNKVIISGNLCQDVTLKYTKSNTPVISNTLAVRNDYKNADGKYDSQFINIVIWNKSAEFVQKYCTKGSKILVEGRFETRQFEDKDSKIVHVTEVIVKKLELLNSKQNTESKKEEIPCSDISEELPF